MTTTDARAENDRLGTVTGPREVTFVRLLPGPIERVWSFLVEAEKRRTWFAGGEIEPRDGGAVSLVFHNADLTAPGETIPERFQKYAGPMESRGRVTRWEPPTGLAYSWWGEPGEASEVSFDLADAGDGRVRLTLVHRALKDRGEMLSVAGGWHAHLHLLAAALEGRPAERFWTIVDGETERAYERAIPQDGA